MKHWHSIALMVYLTIVSFDFLVFPAYYQFMNTRITPDVIIGLSLKFSEPANQIAVIQALSQTKNWQPLTLQASGLFYAAFGAILGIGAWKRTIPDLDQSQVSIAPDPATLQDKNK